MFIFCFNPRPHMLNVQRTSTKVFNVLSIAVHIFRIFLLKNMPSIWANFNHVFELFQGFFFTFLLLRKDSMGTRLDPLGTKLKVNNKDTRTTSETILLTLIRFIHFSGVSTVDFEQEVINNWVTLFLFNTFLANFLILYSLKTPENLWFLGVFRGYKTAILARSGITFDASNS